MKVITAPQNYIPQPNDVLCFLAGGITNCKEWQREVIFTLKRMEGLEHLVVVNPRRDNFPIDDPNAAEEQIAWEFKWLNRADIFSMYFCRSESDQPICMYELGRNLHKMKTDYPTSYEDRIVVSVEDGYKRESDVKIQTILAVSLKASVGTNPICHAYAIAGCYRNLADRKTENSSEKPNNCEHITEDGVTCAKYPACDDCPDNPLNKVKGSERLVKGSENPNNSTISKMEQVDDEFKQFDREALILLIECQKERIAELLAKDEPVDWKDQMWAEAVEDEPQTERKDK